MKQKLLFVFPFVLIQFFSINCQAQKYAEFMGMVRGSVSKAGLPYAAIQLFDTVGNFQNGTITDSTGRFRIDKLTQQKYNVVVSYVGYKTKKVPLNVSERQKYMTFNLVVDNTIDGRNNLEQIFFER